LGECSVEERSSTGLLSYSYAALAMDSATA